LTNRLGIPVGASGNYAITFRFDDGPQTYAVRSFLRPVTDQQHRYETLSKYLSGLSLSFLVGFEYVPEGIALAGKPYPAVFMEWANGKQLHQFVDENHRQADILTELAGSFREAVRQLGAAHIAHGDLQHGNVLVENASRLRLVDYDGIYVPDLDGRPPGEVGHPNYQHPERIRQGFYAPAADSFSALVIYLSLTALATDPSLWSFHNGENLILRADDFRDTGRTGVWSKLKSSPVQEVQRLADILEDACRKPVADVPDLETVLGGPSPPPSHVIAICPQCGGKNRADEVYCQSCAHQLCGNRLCPVCRRSIPAKARFCPKCGQQQTLGPELPGL
jgi:serine/threonine protein kinase